MAIENTESQMRKGLLELCILGIIRKHKEAYPSDILEQLKGSKLVVLEGTLYPLLTRLKNAGMLGYRWEESTSGPPRKYYTLTAEGEAFYTQLRTTWNELSTAVNTLTDTI
jgi:PadR family transcriptional regulator PadR